MKYGKTEGLTETKPQKQDDSFEWIDDKKEAQEAIERAEIIKTIVEDKILNKVEEVKKEEKTPSSMKLYLKTLLNKLLFNMKKKLVPTSFFNKLRTRFVNWWRKNTTEELRDVFLFVTLHGILLLPLILIALVVSSSQIPLINEIRKSLFLTFIVVIFGGGSFYYFLLDISKFFAETFKNKLGRK